MATIPEKTAAGGVAPYWEREGELVILACEQGHRRPVTAALIDADGRVAETMPVGPRECSLRCPRGHCSFHDKVVILEGSK